MKRAISITAITVLALALGGCASFYTDQTDTRYEAGQLATSIRTKARAYSLFSSRQNSQWQAQQTEKTQGAKVGTEQQGATNAAGIAAAIAEGATAAALKAVK